MLLRGVSGGENKGKKNRMVKVEERALTMVCRQMNE